MKEKLNTKAESCYVRREWSHLNTYQDHKYEGMTSDERGAFDAPIRQVVTDGDGKVVSLKALMPNNDP